MLAADQRAYRLLFANASLPPGELLSCALEKFFFFCLKMASLAFRLLPRVLICGHGQSVFLELLEFVLVDALLIFYLDVFAPMSRQYNPTLGGGFLHNLLFSQANDRSGKWSGK